MNESFSFISCVPKRLHQKAQNQKHLDFFKTGKREKFRVVQLIIIKDKDLRSQSEMRADVTGNEVGGAFGSESLTHAR